MKYSLFWGGLNPEVVTKLGSKYHIMCQVQSHLPHPRSTLAMSVYLIGKTTYILSLMFSVFFIMTNFIANQSGLVVSKLNTATD